VRGSYELKMCAFAFKGKNKLCIHLGGAQLHFMNYMCANHIYLANPCVVIKHQKWGDWKSISRVNDILVFFVNTRVINRLFKCEGLLANDSEFINPSKWKDRSIEDLDFWLCILGLRTIKGGCSMKSWGEILSYYPLHLFAIWLRKL
jgi:hypothetical protein